LRKQLCIFDVIKETTMLTINNYCPSNKLTTIIDNYWSIKNDM